MRSGASVYLTIKAMERVLKVLWCLSVILLSSMTMKGQEWLLRGRVLDQADDRPVTGAHITLRGSDAGTTSDKDGRFMLQVPTATKCEVTITHVSYGTLTGTVEALPDGRELTFRMALRTVEIGMVEVRAPAPEVVFERTDLHVGDFRVNDDGIWVLVYGQQRLWHAEQDAGATVYKEARIHLLDTLFQEVASVAIPGEVTALHTDHALRPVVETRDAGWYVIKAGDGLALHRVELTALRKAVLPWTDSVPGALLGNNLNAEYPAFDHIAYDPVKDTARLVCSVVDDFLLELFRSQYKYMSGRDKVVAGDIALRTGLDRETVAGFMTGFSRDLYYKVPYAPLFVVRDTLMVFDHYKGRVRAFTKGLEPLEGPAITYHNERRWKHLLHDRGEGRIYAVYVQALRTWLREVDVHTGQLGPVRMLTHTCPDELQVHDGYAYYVYREPGSLQKRTLYREWVR